jgi:glycosyltransferase involved in cell wall biosynthesis
MKRAMAAFLLDLTHTSHTRARTGIQRVTRSLHREFGATAAAVTHDPFLGAWRPLETWELANLAADTASRSRRAQWPLSARWRGRWKRATGRAGASALRGDYQGFLTAELFSAQVGANLPEIFPRVAVFHDAIALRFPEFTPTGTVTRFPAYLQELLQFDGIAAVSEDSRASLVDYWRWLGVTHPPPVIALPLGVDPVCHPLGDKRAGGVPPVVLSVGTLEGRKNHLALLEACEQLWSRGEKFSLHLAGSVQSETGRPALARIRGLQAAGRPLRFDGPLSDTALGDAYAESAFTVYPSVAEGFGLPVIESLAHGRPCLCSAQGALGELVPGGGVIGLGSVDAGSLASAIARLLGSPAELAVLSSAARARTFKPWRTYAAELSAWMQTLKPRG